MILTSSNEDELQMKRVVKLVAKKPYLSYDSLKSEYITKYHEPLIEEIVPKLTEMEVLCINHVGGYQLAEPNCKVPGLGQNVVKPVKLTSLASQELPDNCSVNASFQIVVTQVETLGKFWFNLFGKEHSFALAELMTNMDVFYTRKESEVFRVSDVKQISPGTFAAAKYKNEGFHRVQVLRNLTGGKAELFYIDYGTIAPLNWKEVFFLVEDFSLLPCQAIEARLWGIKYLEDPSKDSKERKKVRQRFVDLVVNTPEGGLLAIFKGKAGEKVEIQLVDVSGPGNLVDVGVQLVDENLARYELEKVIEAFSEFRGLGIPQIYDFELHRQFSYETLCRLSRLELDVENSMAQIEVNEKPDLFKKYLQIIQRHKITVRDQLLSREA